MIRNYFVVFVLVSGMAQVLFLNTSSAIQPPKKEKTGAINAEIKEKIAERLEELGTAINTLRRQGLRDPWLADIEVFEKAGQWIVKHDEFFRPEHAKWTVSVLEQGLLRAKLASSGNFSWLNARGTPIVRGYRSQIDQSVQPFAVTLPSNFGEGKTPHRLDIILHGRDGTLNEVKFLHRHSSAKNTVKDDFIRIDVYGRGNNAFRWAGESDVFEAAQAFLDMRNRLGQGKFIDPQRVVLRGFSMGGAGTWHIGLHHPGKWAVIGPGAGFSTTHGYIANLPDPLVDWQEKCLSIYDAKMYSENVFHVPTIAYAGSKDKQLQASKNVEAELKDTKYAKNLEILISPGLGHSFPPEWQQKAEEKYQPHVKNGIPDYPPVIHFVTYTLKYPQCHWVRILGLDEHYRKTVVDAKKTEDGFDVATRNVRLLELTSPSGPTQQLSVKIDGQIVDVQPSHDGRLSAKVYLRKEKGSWQWIRPQQLLSFQSRNLQKSPGVQGPIDDGFTGPFLCVRGTGKTWHEKVGKAANAKLDEFQKEWSKWWRGELPVKDDVDVNDADLARYNLILFGDPSSNSLLANALIDLPLQWTKDRIVFGNRGFDAADHLPIMIYPSPFQRDKYVVLNSGHTFHEKDYRGTNALLFPRCGDFAVFSIGDLEGNPEMTSPQDPVYAGLFGEYWQWPDAKGQPKSKETK